MTVVKVKTRKHKNFAVVLPEALAASWAAQWSRQPSTISVKVSK